MGCNLSRSFLATPPPQEGRGMEHVKIGVNTMPKLDMNNHAPGDCKLRIRVLRTSKMKDIIPQI
jgi:hypothetical protein